MVTAHTFGNTLRSLRGALILFSAMALTLAVTFYFVDTTHLTASARAFHGARLALPVLAIPLVAVLPTCLFAIRIDDSTISHLFLRRVVLSRKLLADLIAVDIAGRWGAVFRFRDGSRIRFFGANLEELLEMSRYLETLRPGQLAVSIGAATAALLAVTNKFKRDA
jgi:hypothetical protein